MLVQQERLAMETCEWKKQISEMAKVTDRPDFVYLNIFFQPFAPCLCGPEILCPFCHGMKRSISHVGNVFFEVLPSVLFTEQQLSVGSPS